MTDAKSADQSGDDTQPSHVGGNGVVGFSFGMASHRGRVRDINEDAMMALPHSALWIVADGMGGHARGDLASRTVVESAASVGVPLSIADHKARFLLRMDQANRRISETAQAQGLGTIGATVAALLITNDRFACVWAGDSRIYRLRTGQDAARQMTRDHTVLRAVTNDGVPALDDAGRPVERRALTRAVGVRDVLECDIIDGMVAPGDIFLLCSDGLTEHFTDEEISDCLLTMSNHSPQDICDHLVSETLDRGARDNVTVVCLTLSRAAASPEIDNLPLPDLKIAWQ